MFTYLALAALVAVAAYAFDTVRHFQANRAAAKKTGLPIIYTPISPFNFWWLITHSLWLPFLKALPRSWTQSWLDVMVPDFVWRRLYHVYDEIGSDILLNVNPGPATVFVADPDAIVQITSRRADFPKPTEMYAILDLFGRSVLTTEGQLWRHHRKITGPPFSEKNNRLVWHESLHQAQSMMAGWTGAGAGAGAGGDGVDHLDQDHSHAARPTPALHDVADQAMRLTLHVISLAGFGVRLNWPHEEDPDARLPPGHSLSHRDAMTALLDNITTILLVPRWILACSPLKIHRAAYQAHVEWTKYMWEMYQKKREEVRAGEAREGMDLMGALVRATGIAEASSNNNNNNSNNNDSRKGAGKEEADGGGDEDDNVGDDKHKGNYVFTDDEILGNAFIFLVAGHETTANTVHFSILLLAMHWSSQARLQRDLDAILGDRPASAWTYDDDMPKLFGSMCGAVMNEELRLIPPVVGIPKRVSRHAAQDLHLSDACAPGASGRTITLPAGANVTLVTPALHRHPKYWPHTSLADLDEFRPERWLLDDDNTNNKTNNKTKTPSSSNDLSSDPPPAGPDSSRPDTSASLFRPRRGAYIPFSDGHRSCVGRRFAQVEILAVLAFVFKTWSVELDVTAFLADGEDGDAIEALSDLRRRELWAAADARARGLLRDGMESRVTLQMKKGRVPVRFVRRGRERFKFG